MGREVTDRIQLLPDGVANQIAAGEVIQRPASVVKELLENSVDAQATEVQLIIEDAGKKLIRVVDNGMGMSETDARLSFERHATSKIRKAEDLFAIHTNGFRGEALASIAAIAQVTLHTHLKGYELGTEVVVEGTKVLRQEAASCSEGTSISVKNIFYNIPARRKFLKSDNVETRHIIDEFQRVALAFPNIAFKMYNNGKETFNLKPGTQRQRITGIFGNKYDHRLIPVKEETSLINVGGFVCKPEFSRKTRGEQFFFVNNRFIRHPYLHHAVQGAFDNLIAVDDHPGYFIFMDVDPAQIDINIHPTKTEIKFEDEKSVYAIMQAAVKRSLGMHNIAPSIDFNAPADIGVPPGPDSAFAVVPDIKVDPAYNPFGTEHTGKKPSQEAIEGAHQLFTPGATDETDTTTSDMESQHHELLQLNNTYLLTQLKGGLVIIHRQRAHARVIFEALLERIRNDRSLSQRLLFPCTIELSAQEHAIVTELMPRLQSLGFDIASFSGNAVVVHGVPAEAADCDPVDMIEDIIEQVKMHPDNIDIKAQSAIAATLSNRLSVKDGTAMPEDEALALIGALFACSTPFTDPFGKPTVFNLSYEYLENRFG